jgi:hypothetical protein
MRYCLWGYLSRWFVLLGDSTIWLPFCCCVEMLKFGGKRHINMCCKVTRGKMMKGKKNDDIGNMMSRISRLKTFDNSRFSDHFLDDGTARLAEKYPPG